MASEPSSNINGTYAGNCDLDLDGCSTFLVFVQQESADLKAGSAGSARSSCFEFPPKEVSVSVNFQKEICSILFCLSRFFNVKSNQAQMTMLNT